MALPVLKHPTFELTVPSNKQKIKYRPFLVKEEKILLLAQSSENIKDMIQAILPMSLSSSFFGILLFKNSYSQVLTVFGFKCLI